MYLQSNADSRVSATMPGQTLIKSPRYLLPENMSRTGGIGPTLQLDADRGKLLVVTLAINQVVEHGGITVAIWGSADGTDWGMQPLLSFPQKYYCGLYSLLLNLATRPEIRYLRAHWSMRGWGKSTELPLFGFQLYLEESGARLTIAVA